MPFEARESKRGLSLVIRYWHPQKGYWQEPDEITISPGIPHSVEIALDFIRKYRKPGDGDGTDFELLLSMIATTDFRQRLEHEFSRLCAERLLGIIEVTNG